MAGEINAGEATSEPGWPTPDDPSVGNLDSQTRELIEATQPEALAASLEDTLLGAFHALSALATFAGAYPDAALQNAMAKLPPEQAQLFSEQLEFARTYGHDRHATRAEDIHFETQLFELVMKAAHLRSADSVSS